MNSQSFTISPAIVMSSHDLTGFPGEVLGVTSATTPTFFPNPCGVVVACLTGFGAGDTITVTSTVTTSVAIVTTTVATGNGLGTFGVVTLDANTGFLVADNTEGAHVITATDSTATPNLVATTSFTVSPWVAFYDSPLGATTFSVTAGTPLTSLYVDGHGFPAGTIAANSITVNGEATTHSALTIGSTGAFAEFQVGPPTGGFPLGPITVTVDGISFSYTAGNIADSSVAAGIYAAGGILSPTGPASTENWGGALIGSEKGAAGAGTAFITLSSSTYMPGTPIAPYYGPAPNQNTIGIFGYGFVNAANSPGVVKGANSPNIGAITYVSDVVACVPATGASCVDGNGAFLATAPLGDTPFSNTVPASSTPTAYGITAPSGGTNPGSVNTPSFTITPWIDPFSVTGFTINYQSTLTWVVHGFGQDETVTYKVGGTAFPVAETVFVGATGTAAAPAASQVPDLASGLTTISATGGTTGAVASEPDAVNYVPLVDNVPGTAVAAALFPNAGSAGSTTILRTGSNYGVHGLAADTSYNVVWNAISGSVTLGTFESSATGGIPAPGVQITLPTDTSGIHIIDIQAAATSGTSALFGTVAADYAVPDLGAVYTSQYGDLLFSLGANLVASPTAVNVGETISLTGTGLQAGSSYDVGLAASVAGSCVGQHGNAVLAAFTATASGTVPTGIGVKLTDQPAITYGGEQASLFCLSVQTAANFNTANGINTAAFDLQASGTVSPTAAPSGTNVVMTFHGLFGGGAYNVIFNPSISINNAVSGEVIGAVLAGANGAATSTVTVPNFTPGTYVLQLCPVGIACTTASVALASPPTITIGSVATTCNSTSCVSITSPTQTTEGVYTGVSSSFTNNSNAPISAVVYAVVHNALGQTVDISTATISAPAGGSTSAFNVLFGLPSGTYSVTLFVTSSSGTAISSTSTVSVTI